MINKACCFKVVGISSWERVKINYLQILISGKNNCASKCGNGTVMKMFIFIEKQVVKYWWRNIKK